MKESFRQDSEQKQGRWGDRLEETLIALILGIMVTITFANVIARYIFDTHILWALELSVFLFAWLVLLGAAYGVRKNIHPGVDFLINRLGPDSRRIWGLIVVGLCLIFSLLMLKGGWDYWANFANLPATKGRWFPTGFEDQFRPLGWYEVDDVPLPAFLGWMEAMFNDGQAYEKIPRLIPYTVLPLAMALLVWRFCVAGRAIWQRKIDRLIMDYSQSDSFDSPSQADQKKPQAGDFAHHDQNR